MVEGPMPSKPINKAKRVKKVMSKFTKTIWVSYKGIFEKKMNRLNSILRRHGKSEIKFSYANYRAERVEFTYHRKGEAFATDEVSDKIVEMCDVICDGVTDVKKDDKNYTFIGTVQFGDGVKQVFVKDEAYASYFMDDFRDGICDHCGVRRNNRKSYYMFLAEDGEVLQIGSTCAKEYFGIDSVAFLEAQGNTFFVDYSGWEGASARETFCACYENIFSAVDFATAGFTKWVKANEGGCDPRKPITEWSTTAAAREICNADPFIPHPWDGYNGNMGMVTREECAAYWGKRYADKGDSFAYNCKEALKRDYATDNGFGAYCYAIFGAMNAKFKEMLEEKTKGQENVMCRFEVGKRVNFMAEILTVREVECESCYDGYHAEFSTRFSINAKGDDGCLYHFTTGAAGFDKLKVGDKVEIRAKIEKSHEYKGKVYTNLSRPTLIDSPALREEARISEIVEKCKKHDDEVFAAMDSAAEEERRMVRNETIEKVVNEEANGESDDVKSVTIVRIGQFGSRALPS